MQSTYVKVKTIMDETASSTTYFATAARPNTSFTMANTAFASTHNGGGAVITVTTAGSGDSGKTVTSAEMSAQPAGNVSLGFNASRGMGMFGGRTALKGFTSFSGGTAGDVKFHNVSSGLTSTATPFMQYRTNGTADNETHFNIPAPGVLCNNGLQVTYTLDNIDQMNVLYNG